MARRFPHKDLAAVDRNARRRLYDAVKVMSAVGTIHKFAKKLKWLGVRHLHADVPDMRRMIRTKKSALLSKQRALQHIVRSITHFRRLLAHRRTRSSRLPCAQHCSRFYFPFVLLRCSTPNVSSSPDRTRLTIHMNHPFSLFSETDIVSMLHPTSPASRLHSHPCARSVPLPVQTLSSPSSPTASNPTSHPTSPIRPPQQKTLIMMRLKDHVGLKTEPVPLTRVPHPPRTSSAVHGAEPASPTQPHYGAHHQHRHHPRLIEQSLHALEPMPPPPPPLPPPLQHPCVKLTLRLRPSNIKIAPKPHRCAHIAHRQPCSHCASPPPQLASMSEQRASYPRSTVDRSSIWAALVDEVAGKRSNSSPHNNNSLNKHPVQKTIVKNDHARRHGAHTGCRTVVEPNISASAMQVMEEELICYINDGQVDEPQQETQEHADKQPSKQEIDLLCYEQLDFESLAEVADQQQARVMANPPPLFCPPLHVEPVIVSFDEEHNASRSEIVPYHTRPVNEDDLLDLDIDMDVVSDPCLSDGVS
ncbi:unnamed protein product [Agarophyton chilense]